MDQTPPTSITTRGEFVATVKALFADALAHGMQELWLVDPDFSSWPMGERDTIETLTRWAQLPHRRLYMLALHYDEMPRRHPRFVQWRRTWDHAVRPRAVVDTDISEVPTLMLADNPLGMRLIERTDRRGYWFRDATEWKTWREVVDALSQRSCEAFPATILGL